MDGRALELFPAVVQVTNLGRILGLWGGTSQDVINQTEPTRLVQEAAHCPWPRPFSPVS